MAVPFSPAVYEHAAAFTNHRPVEVANDAELLYQAHLAAYECYQHSPIVIGIDIYNLEAEAYGGKTDDPGDDGIPAITTPIVSSIDQALQLPPFDPSRDGRICMVIDVGKKIATKLPERDVRIPVSGPFSIAVSLRGLNGLLEDVIMEPDKTRQWLLQLAENQAAFCHAIVDAGLDIAFFESAATPPMLSPKLFNEIELPALCRVIEIATEAVQHPVPCIIGGNTTPILEDLLSTGTGFVICPSETNQEKFMEKMKHYPDIVVRINMDPQIVSAGSKDELINEIDRVLALAKTRPKTLVGTGVVPYETPPENILFIGSYLENHD